MLNVIYDKYIGRFFSDKNNLFVIFISVIVALISYFSFFINEVLVQDTIWQGSVYIANYHERGLGRWFITFIDSFRNGLVAKVPIFFCFIFFIIVSSILIIKILKIKNRLIMALISVALIVFPSISDVLMFTYTVDSYGVGIFMATLAAYFFNKNCTSIKKSIVYKILGVFSVILSLSLYQVYIGITATLCVLVSIKDLLEEKKIKIILKDLILNVIFCFVASLLYYFICNIILKVYNQPFEPYRNADQFGLEKFSVYIEHIKYSYTVFNSFFFKDEYIINSICLRQWMNIAIILCALILGCIYIVNKKLYKNILNILVIVVLIFTFPIYSNIINIIIPTKNITSLMIYPFVLFYIGILMLVDVFVNKSKVCKILLTGCLVIMTYILYTFIMSNSISYVGKNSIYQSYYSNMLKIISQIENEYRSEENNKILFIGNFGYDYTEFSSWHNKWEFSGYNLIEKNFTGYNLIDNFCEQYMGYSYEVCTYEECKQILKTDEYMNMKTYPDDNYIAIIDNIIVVKLSEFEEE